MAHPAHLPPLQRDALSEMLRSPTHTLVRQGGDFVALSGRSPKSGAQQVRLFTKRLVKMLDRAALVDLDDREFPTRATLTRHGLHVAQQLRGKCAHPGCTQTDGLPCAYAQCPNRQRDA